MSTGIGSFQQSVMGVLDRPKESTYAPGVPMHALLSAAEIADKVFYRDQGDDWKPSQTQIVQVHRALRSLLGRGLVEEVQVTETDRGQRMRLFRSVQAAKDRPTPWMFQNYQMDMTEAEAIEMADRLLSELLGDLVRIERTQASWVVVPRIILSMPNEPTLHAALMRAAFLNAWE